jgi:hypothetical protein
VGFQVFSYGFDALNRLIQTIDESSNAELR